MVSATPPSTPEVSVHIQLFVVNVNLVKNKTKHEESQVVLDRSSLRQLKTVSMERFDLQGEKVDFQQTKTL